MAPYCHMHVLYICVACMYGWYGWYGWYGSYGCIVVTVGFTPFSSTKFIGSRRFQRKYSSDSTHCRLLNTAKIAAILRTRMNGSLSLSFIAFHRVSCVSSYICGDSNSTRRSSFWSKSISYAKDSFFPFIHIGLCDDSTISSLVWWLWCRR